MNILFNQLPALGHKTGVGYYTNSLMTALTKQDLKVAPYPSPLVLDSLHRYRETRSILTRIYKHLIAGARGNILSQFLRKSSATSFRAIRTLAKTLAHMHHKYTFNNTYFDLYHEPNFVPFESSLPTISTIHDLSPLLHPEWHPKERVHWFNKGMSNALRASRHLIAVSEFTKSQLISCLNIPPHKVTCVYNGIHPGMVPLRRGAVKQALKRLNLPPRYFLCVGTVEPRKNLLTLLKAFCSLPERIRTRFPLVLVGMWGWKAHAIAEYYYNYARARGVLHIGYLDEADLPSVYNGARALAYPSFYEGFGLPPIEMSACGGAVITSTAKALVETTGGLAHYVHAEDIGGWRDELQMLADDSDYWQTLQSASSRIAMRYSWDTCAKETVEVYKKAVSPNQLQTSPVIPNKAA